jgi:hypothetical protein
VVCEVYSLDSAGAGLLGLRNVAARSQAFTFCAGRHYGSFPAPVADWLSATVEHELLPGVSGRRLLQRFGTAPGNLEDHHWADATALFSDATYPSFYDALQTAVLL